MVRCALGFLLVGGCSLADPDAALSVLAEIDGQALGYDRGTAVLVWRAIDGEELRLAGSGSIGADGRFRIDVTAPPPDEAFRPAPTLDEGWSDDAYVSQGFVAVVDAEAISEELNEVYWEDGTWFEQQPVLFWRGPASPPVPRGLSIGDSLQGPFRVPTDVVLDPDDGRPSEQGLLYRYEAQIAFDTAEIMALSSLEDTIALEQLAAVPFATALCENCGQTFSFIDCDSEELGMCRDGQRLGFFIDEALASDNPQVTEAWPCNPFGRACEEEDGACFLFEGNAFVCRDGRYCPDDEEQACPEEPRP